MWYIIIFLIVSAGCALSISGCIPKNNAGNINNDSIADGTVLPKDTVKTPLTKEEIIKRLKILAKSPAPKELKPGAMCYEATVRPDRAEYTCPICGEKTLYTSNRADFILSDIPACRSLIGTIRGVEIKLDESQFCKKCSPKVKEPSLCVDIKYKGETKAEKVCDISKIDLQVLNEFFNGSQVHRTFNAEEEPLKDYIDRLQKILNVSIK